jgi:hypothetical protein
MQNLSAFGTGITVVALSTFPVGFSLSEFADDSDPLVIDDVEPVGSENLVDGSIFFFDKAAPVKVVVSLIAGSQDDLNCKILLQARKGSSSIINIPDITSLVINYPSTGLVAFSEGSIVSGPLGDSIQQSGRFKGNKYTFMFGAFSGAQSFTELATDVLRSVTGF